MRSLCQSRKKNPLVRVGRTVPPPPAEPPPEEEEDTTTLMSAVDDRVLPELAVILRADDAVLQSRSRADVPDSHHSSLASFYRRMAAYRANHTATSKPQKSVIAWCRAILTNVEGHPRAMSMLMLDTTSIASSEEEYSSVKHSIREAIGVPHFYRPTAPEVREAEATARLVEERRQLEALKAAEEAEKKRIEAEEAALKKKRIHERRYCSIQEEQKLAAAMQRMPLQSYLMETVVRAITEGIQATSELRPPGPSGLPRGLLIQVQTQQHAVMARGFPGPLPTFFSIQLSVFFPPFPALYASVERTAQFFPLLLVL